MTYLLSGTLDFVQRVAIAIGDKAHYNNLKQYRQRRTRELQELYDQLTTLQELHANDRGKKNTK